MEIVYEYIISGYETGKPVIPPIEVLVNGIKTRTEPLYFVIFNPDATFVVDPVRLFHRHPITPYAGMTLRGVVEQTILRGEVVLRDGAISGPPGGQLLSTT